MFDHIKLTSEEIEAIVSDLNKVKVLEDNSRLLKEIKGLEDLNLNDIEILCQKLISSKIKLNLLSIKALYSVFTQQYESASEQGIYPYATQFFSLNIRLDDLFENLIQNHFDYIAENNVKYLSSLFLNIKANANVVFHYLCILEESEVFHSAILNNLDPNGKRPTDLFFDIICVILEKNHNWLFNLLVMQTFTWQIKTIDPQEIKVLEDRIEQQFLSEFKMGKVTHEDLEINFHRGDLSPLKMKMVDSVATLLNIDEIPSVSRKLAVEELFVKKDAKENDAAYMNYLVFILNNFEECSDFLKTIEVEYPFIVEQLFYYKINPVILKKVDLEKFFDKETPKLIGDHSYALLSSLILKSLDKEVNREQINKMTSTMLTAMYEYSITDLSSMVFIKQAHHLKENAIQDVEYSVNGRIYYNNQGYLLENSNSKRLFLENTNVTPIGYSVYLPPLDIECKNIIVNVYGGHKAGSDNGYKPGQIGDFHKSLLNQGTAIITLNLPDLLELKVYQGNMPIDLHNKIHECINKFYQTLKNHPENLHHDLKDYNLQDKPTFLYGASFGGALSIRHGQMYPGTFTGYMSHDGPLSREISTKSDLLNRTMAEIWLDPAQKDQIANMADPVLLMHTKSDNNVSEKETEAFYKALRKNKKSHLARVHITEVGNPIFTDKYSKGHAVPTDKDEFMRYINTLSSYMENGPAILPAMTKWQVYKHSKSANKFYKSATLQQKFIAEVLDKERVYHTEKSNFTSLVSVEKIESDKVWDLYYKPLFYGMYYANSLCQNKAELMNEIKRLIGTQILNDEVIQNALSYQASEFSQYMKECYGIEITQEQIKTNSDLVEQFKETLNKLPLKDPAYVKHMLSTLYLSNPSVLSSLYSKFEKNNELQMASNNAKNKLINMLSKEKKMIAFVWQETARKILQKEQNKQVPNLSDSSSIKKFKK